MTSRQITRTITGKKVSPDKFPNAMKLHILSDLHFEFDKCLKSIDVNTIDAGVTVLAGDISVGLKDGVRTHYRSATLFSGE